jgi:hypothetical protein
LVPKVGECVPAAAAPKLEAASVRVPHLLIFRMDDAVLLPASRAQLAAYCDDSERARKLPVAVIGWCTRKPRT